jgi:hypothetical protein
LKERSEKEGMIEEYWVIGGDGEFQSERERVRASALFKSTGRDIFVFDFCFSPCFSSYECGYPAKINNTIKGVESTVFLPS